MTNITDQLAAALRAILNDGGPAAMGSGYEALAAFDVQANTATPGRMGIEPLQATQGADMALCCDGRVVAIIQHDPDIQTSDDPDHDSVVWTAQDHADARRLVDGWNAQANTATPSTTGDGITRDELATILAALSYYRLCGLGEPENRPIEIHDIATDGGNVMSSLNDEGIDELCEKLNSSHDITAEAKTYDDRLNELEICPNGDDYNNLLRIIAGETGLMPHVTGR